MKKRISCVLGVLLFIILINIFSVSAITGEIGNARAILRPEMQYFNTTMIERTILVKNPNDVAVNITMQVAEGGAGIIDLIDEEFVLQPGEEKKAEFIITLKKIKDYSEKINVIFIPSEGKGAKVALAASIIILPESDGIPKALILLISTTVVLIVFLILVLLLIKKRRKKNE